MIIKVNYDHIFFDRYAVDRESEARSIVTRALDEIGCEWSENGMIFEIQERSIEEEVKLERLAELLKHEFFILLEPVLPEEDKPEKPTSDTIEDYVRENYQYEYLTAARICEALGLSRREGDLRALALLGMTLSEYIRAVRVEKAQKMLAGGVKIEQCAENCGFGSVKTMQRAFRAICSMSPSEWRASVLDSKELK